MELILKTKFLVVLAVVTFLTGCYSFIGKYGDPFYKGKDQHHFEKLIDPLAA